VLAPIGDKTKTPTPPWSTLRDEGAIVPFEASFVVAVMVIWLLDPPKTAITVQLLVTGLVVKIFPFRVPPQVPVTETVRPVLGVITKTPTPPKVTDWDEGVILPFVLSEVIAVIVMPLFEVVVIVTDPLIVVPIIVAVISVVTGSEGAVKLTIKDPPTVCPLQVVLVPSKKVPPLEEVKVIVASVLFPDESVTATIMGVVPPVTTCLLTAVTTTLAAAPPVVPEPVVVPLDMLVLLLVSEGEHPDNNRGIKKQIIVTIRR
jgi:hypothetical protein